MRRGRRTNRGKAIKAWFELIDRAENDWKKAKLQAQLNQYLLNESERELNSIPNPNKVSEARARLQHLYPGLQLPPVMREKHAQKAN